MEAGRMVAECYAHSPLGGLVWVWIPTQLQTGILVLHRQRESSVCAIPRMDIKLASSLPTLVDGR